MKKRMSESIKVASALTFIGGFLEIYSYLLKGVFATTITGNIILLTYKLTHGNTEILRYFGSITAFILGIIFSEQIRKKFSFISYLHWREWVLILEAIIIITIAFINSYMIPTVMLIAFLSGLQIQSFNKVEEAVYMSTMCTGNTKKLINSILQKDRFKIFIFSCIVSSFISGVIIGSLLIHYIQGLAILFLLIPLCMIYIFIHIYEED